MKIQLKIPKHSTILPFWIIANWSVDIAWVIKFKPKFERANINEKDFFLLFHDKLRINIFHLRFSDNSIGCTRKYFSYEIEHRTYLFWRFIDTFTKLCFIFRLKSAKKNHQKLFENQRKTENPFSTFAFLRIGSGKKKKAILMLVLHKPPTV